MNHSLPILTITICIIYKHHSLYIFVTSLTCLLYLFSSVSQRVAEERGEPLGQSSGFQIRLESTLPRNYGSVLYCTTGVLLRRLIGDPYVMNPMLLVSTLSCCCSQCGDCHCCFTILVNVVFIVIIEVNI